ncbi:hypothetical protein NliqN6_2137 [Naganishia liquefaciens]|uniref:HRDC domain-containing protein n=1 Tax=Naganishia liquefaciens TaxID=104408 RepID=A0A8H3YDR6_9TREE|nr:hypothetical protein NliqN6_2137 [Naganishia liquefaciens]
MSADPSIPTDGNNAVASSSTQFDMPAFFPALQAALAQPTQHVNDFPEGDDLKMHRTLDRKLGKRLDATTNRVLALASRLVDFVASDAPAAAAAAGGLEGRQRDGTAPAFATVGIRKRKRLAEEDDAVHEFQDQVVEVLDSLLERADINLDTVTGKRKATEISQQAEATLAARQRAQDAKRAKESGAQPPLPDHIINADIPKPQATFDSPVDNSNKLPPWTPTLPVKHHAMVPLDYIPTPSSSRPASPEIEGTTTSTPGITEIRGITVRHPYLYESKHLGYPSSLFTAAPPLAPRSFADTPFTWIDTPETLDRMVHKLKQAKELAVDLEYHSTRSFTGFLCLMQISTREEDFVVDVIRLRKEVREGKLGGVLADPSIIKVFHGAESDILWLQQDFDLYVVGLFDTYHATKVLHYPQHSLASLLALFCDFTADKRYQVADWRIRPLPHEMLHYARSDTHFLLYVYDQLRNSLLERAQGKQDLIRQVLKRSEETALKLYTRVSYDAERGFGMNGWRSLLKKQMGHKGATTLRDEYGSSGDTAVWGLGEMGQKKERVFKRLHAWRDTVARSEDESPFYVMPNGMLWAIVQRLPQAEDPLLRTVEASKSRIPIKRKDELLRVIFDACQEGSEAYARALQRKKAELGLDATAGSATKPLTGMDVEETATSASQSSNISLSRPSRLLWASGPSVGSVRPVSSLLGTTLHASGLRPIESQSGPSRAILRRILSDFSSRLSAGQSEQTDDNTSPQIDGLTAATAENTAPEPMAAVDTSVPEQIPYVPSEARSTKEKAMKDKNAIVQVAKSSSSAKKRKSKVDVKAERPADVQTSDVNEPDSPAPTAKKAKRVPVKAEAIPEFDYSQEPNQLDTFEPASTVKDKRKKPRKSKQPIVDLSNFRKPPQDPANVASGNKSRTF